MKFICRIGKCRRRPATFDTLEELWKHIGGKCWNSEFKGGKIAVDTGHSSRAQKAGK